MTLAVSASSSIGTNEVTGIVFLRANLLGAPAQAKCTASFGLAGETETVTSAEAEAWAP